MKWMTTMANGDPVAEAQAVMDRAPSHYTESPMGEALATMIALSPTSPNGGIISSPVAWGLRDYDPTTQPYDEPFRHVDGSWKADVQNDQVTISLDHYTSLVRDHQKLTAIESARCEDCPPKDYPTDRTRCALCEWREVLP